MALNKFMHPRNKYKSQKPDFKDLAVKYDYFRERVTQNLNGKVILDFKEPASLRALTQALLEEDFGLFVTLPVDRLIPTVPLRLNYILWLEDILGVKEHAKGIDIGTGASCIYPLLGCKQNGWGFLASEVDDQNIEFALKNVEKNQFQDKIKIKKVEEDKILLGVVEESETYEFCMCNPPFFSDHLEAQGIPATRSDDRPEPQSVCTASETESIAWGGEVRFVCQMIEESLVLKDKIRVYTSMLGKKMSLSLIKDELIKKKITMFSSTEFCQGRTMRWAIAWTFDETVTFPKSLFKKSKKPVAPLAFEVPRTIKAVSDYTVQAFTDFVKDEIEGLKINYHVKHSGKFYSYLVLQANENTWSHQRQKRRQEKFAAMKNKADGNEGTNKVESSEVEMVCCQTSSSNKKDGKHVLSSDGDHENDSETQNKNNLDKETNENISKSEEDSLDCLKRKREVSVDGSSKRSKSELENGNLNKGECAVDNCKSENSEAENIRSEEKITDRSAVDIATNKDVEKSDSCESKNATYVETEANINKDASVDLKVIECKEALPGENQIVTEQEGSNTTHNLEAVLDPNKMPSRADIIKQFWAEQNANTKKLSTKRAPHSVYERMESFGEDEDCLVQLKLMVRKDEGVVNFHFTHLTGQKEAVHQIMQYFRNKLK